ncbi:transporter substrate-binding domain-containing protein [Pseudodesulfovibrio sp. zrk46]|uniref:transporter substrate-binding domain-containing protein n=1 Tax=Pseudodesulfovibrio sp. zrk46 TaxID=2725288 RepID=UPI001449B9D6|nr:transporter substrate-binding domain-containing protein [Pseudodesulfovibrio sp. zrk46]QJB56342.1 transporter substrate-binding domain-containing protein [Pseudodesulfovibrio sp. zrk46]
MIGTSGYIRNHHWPLLLLTAWFMAFAAYSTPAMAQNGKKDVTHLFSQTGLLLGLTTEEKLYLGNKNEVTFACDPSWAPFEFVDNEERYSGMGADYLKLISQRIGIPFRRIPTKNWTESLKLARDGKCDVLPILNKTPERSQYLLFTSPYFTSSYVVIGKGGQWLSNGMSDMRGKTMALVRGYKMDEDIRRDFPSIKVKHVDTMEQALFMVSEGNAYATISTTLESAHLIRKNQLKDLRVIAHTEFFNEPRMGIRKDDHILATIMRKAIRSITNTEKEVISSKWVAEDLQVESNNPLVIRLVLVLLVCLTGVYLAYKKLR